MLPVSGGIIRAAAVVQQDHGGQAEVTVRTGGAVLGTETPAVTTKMTRLAAPSLPWALRPLPKHSGEVYGTILTLKKFKSQNYREKKAEKKSSSFAFPNCSGRAVQPGVLRVRTRQAGRKMPSDWDLTGAGPWQGSYAACDTGFPCGDQLESQPLPLRIPQEAVRCSECPGACTMWETGRKLPVPDLGWPTLLTAATLGIANGWKT